MMLEVDVMQTRLYQGSSGKDEIVSYMQAHGLELTSAASQNHGKEENLTFCQSYSDWMVPVNPVFDAAF
jgi:hypothetical protein